MCPKPKQPNNTYTTPPPPPVLEQTDPVKKDGDALMIRRATGTRKFRAGFVNVPGGVETPATGGGDASNPSSPRRPRVRGGIGIRA